MSADYKHVANTTQDQEGAVQNPVEKTKKSKNAFRTISEVADELGVQQHVLRFWETKFSQVRPLKRGGGRRYYRPEDVTLLKRIHELLYTEGYTIKGVQKLFRENGKNSVLDGEVGGIINEAPAQTGSSGKLDADQKEILEDMLAELKELRAIIKG
ncbi:MAG: MerR family transcriptional regulator [Alphaproteobacteria bacterium]